MVGGGFGFAAAIQPGPFQAFLISRVAATDWKRTLPACLAPVISDVPIAILVISILGRIPVPAQNLLRAAGGALLVYLAWTTLRHRLRPADTTARDSSAPRTLIAAVMVNLLNPNPYLAWALVLGPTALAAWNQHPSHAVALVGAMYCTMIAVFALFVFLVGTIRFLGSAGQRALVGASGTILAILGLYLLVTGIGSVGA